MSLLPSRAAALLRHTHLWLPGYVATRLRRFGEPPPTDLWVTIADHFEPLWNGAHEALARDRVAGWRRQWPEIAARHRDSDGHSPVYTFFYPQEEYRPELLSPLAEMTRARVADVEVHIHHDGEGESRFVDNMQGFLGALEGRHGLLRRRHGRVSFGFIHGNWALDNSRPDGRWCGLNNEITLLRDLGCYADFTLPAANSPCQAGPVNVIFRATDDPLQPRSHASGTPLRRNGRVGGDLTLIPGPLGFGLRPRRPWRPLIESGELAGYMLPSTRRVRLWLRLAPRLGGHVFLKLFGHGAQERNASPLLGGALDLLFNSIVSECRDRGVRLHFTSAWNMFRALEAVEVGIDPLTVL